MAAKEEVPLSGALVAGLVFRLLFESREELDDVAVRAGPPVTGWFGERCRELVAPGCVASWTATSVWMESRV